MAKRNRQLVAEGSGIEDRTLKPSIPQAPMFSRCDLSGGEVACVQDFRSLSEDHRAELLAERSNAALDLRTMGETPVSRELALYDLTLPELHVLALYRSSPHQAIEIISSMFVMRRLERLESDAL